jgi:hypothetical protein
MIRYWGMKSLTKYNNAGEPFTVYRREPEMPRIDDQFLDCSIYLYHSEKDAERGESTGGSGFLVAMPCFGDGWLLEGECPQGAYHHLYAVTNRHVIEGDCSVVRLNKDSGGVKDGYCSVIPFTPDNWTCINGHDIAVAPIDYKENNKWLFVSTDRFLTKKIAADFDVGIGDETFTVGRFINHDGRQQNTPSLRWGHVAMMPREVANSDNPTQSEESFIVETHSISGYSGSPIFVRPLPTDKLLAQSQIPQISPTNSSVFPQLVSKSPSGLITSRTGGPWLLGIHWAYLHNWVDEEIMVDGKIMKDTKRKIRVNTGMSAVVPAWHLLELLERDEFVVQRKVEQKKLLERIQRNNDGVTLL